MKKPILGFDLDGVLYDWHQAAYDYLVRFCGLTEPYEEFMFSKSKFLSNKNKLFMENLLRLEDLYYKFAAKKDDVETLNYLSGKYHIIYVTSRPKEAEIVTYKWLRDFKFPNVSEIYHSDNKIEKIRLLKCDYYVEDLSWNAVDLSKFLTVILKARKYNKDYQQYFTTIHEIKELKTIL